MKYTIIDEGRVYQIYLENLKKEDWDELEKQKLDKEFKVDKTRKIMSNYAWTLLNKEEGDKIIENKGKELKEINVI